MSLDEHKNLDDAQLHPPKGFAAAANNTAPLKDSTGTLVWQEGGSSKEVTSVVTVTSAEVLAMHQIGQEVELIAAQGAGTAIQVTGITATIDYNTATYTGGANLQIRYTDRNGETVNGMQIQSTLVNSSADAAQDLHIGYNKEFTDMELNAPVVVSNNGAAYLTGDSDIKIHITYKVITL